MIDLILEDESGSLVDNLAAICFTAEDDRASDRPIPEDGYLKSEQEMLENQREVLIEQYFLLNTGLKKSSRSRI